MINYEQLDCKALYHILTETLFKNEIPSASDDFECFDAIERRKAGKTFSFSEHFKGAIFAMLGSQRTWAGIKANSDKICEIFFQFDKHIFEYTTTNELLFKIKEIKCGNKNIRRQIEGIPEMLDTFVAIEKEFGTLDNFILHDTPIAVATLLIETKKYKLKGLGSSLVFDYLRNIGIDIAKPDTHLMRLFGSERLGVSTSINATQFEVLEIIESIAKANNVSPALIGTMFWSLCAKGYGNLCGANPKCKLCGFDATYCLYNREREMK